MAKLSKSATTTVTGRAGSRARWERWEATHPGRIGGSAPKKQSKAIQPSYESTMRRRGNLSGF